MNTKTLSILTLSGAMTATSTISVLAAIHLNEGFFAGFVLFVSIMELAWVALYRLLLATIPLKESYVKPNTIQDFGYNAYILINLFFINPVIKSNLVPVPIMMIYYKLLGLKFGRNTYSAGQIQDPTLTEIGDNTLIGDGSLIYCHIIEGDGRMGALRVKIGSNVMIGGRSIIMPGCVIEDGAKVGIGALVTKGTHIRKNEIWAGVPAKRLEKQSLLTEMLYSTTYKVLEPR